MLAFLSNGARLIDMLKKTLYVIATVIVLVGLIYTATMSPRPCGMDDVSTSCGSGARWNAAIGTVVVAMLLFYVGRAVGNRQD